MPRCNWTNAALFVYSLPCILWDENKIELNWIKSMPFFSKIAWKSYPKRSLGGLCRFLKKSTLSCRYLLSDDSTFGQRGKKTQQQQLKCPKLVKLLKINPIKIWKFSVWRPYEHVFLTNWWLYSLISYFFSCLKHWISWIGAFKILSCQNNIITSCFSVVNKKCITKQKCDMKKAIVIYPSLFCFVFLSIPMQWQPGLWILCRFNLTQLNIN